MKKKHRELLRRVMVCCNKFGAPLDGTSTPEIKYQDRQKMHMNVYHVLYAVLADHPENEFSRNDFEKANAALEEMEAMSRKNYPDRNGNHSPQIF